MQWEQVQIKIKLKQLLKNLSWPVYMHFWDILNSALRFPSVKSRMEQVSISDYGVKRIPGQHHSSFILHCTTDLKETGVFIHICTSMFTL